MTTTSQPARRKKSLALRAARVVVVFVVIPYLALVGIVAVTQRSLIYHPKRDSSLNVRPAHVHGGSTEPVSFASADGVELHGWQITADSSSPGRGSEAVRKNGKPLVLYFCGNANHRGNRTDDFALLLDAGADVVCFDYRGYGDNAGSPSEQAIASDAHAIWRFLVDQRHIDPQRIVIYGESLGGGVATRLAAELSAANAPPAGLMLRSTFSRLPDVGAVHFPWLPVRLLLIDRFPSVERIARVTCPILILHGQQDTIVPYELGEQLFAAGPQTSGQGVAKRFVPLKAADHNDVLETEGGTVAKAIREFFDTISPRIAPRNDPKDKPMFAELVRKLTYFPDRADDLSPQALRLPIDRVHAITCKTSDGLTLHGWHLLADGKSAVDRGACDRELAAGRPLVLFFSGNGGNRAYRTPEAGVLTHAGADVFLFDYRGYGDNAGEPSEQSLAADAGIVWRYATDERHMSPDRIILYGESLGGAVATRLAAENCTTGTPPAGLIVRSTFSSLVDVAQHHYPLLPVKMLLQEHYASTQQIPHVTCPILLLHGELDTIVPYALGRKLFAAAPERSAGGVQKRLVDLPHSDHNDVLEADRKTLQDTVREFIGAVSKSE